MPTQKICFILSRTIPQAWIIFFLKYFYCFAIGIEQDFCIKTSTDKAQDWPAGRYCILKHDSCPVGFADG